MVVDAGTNKTTPPTVTPGRPTRAPTPPPTEGGSGLLRVDICRMFEVRALPVYSGLGTMRFKGGIARIVEAMKVIAYGGTGRL